MIFGRMTIGLATGLALALAQAAPAKAAETYDVTVIMPLTGGGSFLGKAEQQALQLLEKTVNRDGGIHGKPLHLVFQDDQSSPQTAVQLASQVVGARPTVILGSSIVAMCNAMAPLMRNGPVMYCLSPGIHPSAGSYVFTSSVSTHDLAQALIRYFRLRGWTRIALMSSTDASGQDAEKGILEVMALPENKDLKLVENAHFNPTDVSVAAQIETIKAANPQALIAWSTGSPIGTVFKAIIQAGLDVPVATTNGNMTFAQMSQYADFLPKELYIPSSPWPAHGKEAALEPAVETAQKRFFAAFQEANVKPDVAASLAWDPGAIVVDMLRKLPADAKAGQLREAIAGLKDYAGVNGMYDFTKTPQRGLDETDAVVTRWNAAEKTWQIVSKPRGIPIGK